MWVGGGKSFGLSGFCGLLQLMLGDIVISVETAAKQAEERGHTLLDEIRILMVGQQFSTSYFNNS